MEVRPPRLITKTIGPVLPALFEGGLKGGKTLINPMVNPGRDPFLACAKAVDQEFPDPNHGQGVHLRADK